VAEQRYQAVLAVIKDGRTVTETAAAVGVSRQTLHAWLGKYETGGLESLVDRSHRPWSSPQQMPAVVEVAVLEARRRHPSWGPRRIAVELTKRDGGWSVTESSVYRCLRRAGLVEPDGRRRRKRGLEAVGAGPAERVVADGHCGWVPAGRRHVGGGVDRNR